MPEREPGWYRQAIYSQHHRYWDGERWTRSSADFASTRLPLGRPRRVEAPLAVPGDLTRVEPR